MRWVFTSGVLLLAVGMIVGYSRSSGTAPQSPLVELAPGGATASSDKPSREAQPVLPVTRAGDPEASPRLGSELEGLRQERDPGMLVQRLLGVWRSAADGPVSEEVLAELSSYTFDADPEVAHTAMRALEDLERLRARRAQADEGDGVEQSLGSLVETLGEGLAEPPEDPQQLAEDRWRLEEEGLQRRFAEVRDAPAVERLAAVQELWRYAADLSDLGLLAEAIVEAKVLALAETEPSVSQRLRAAADDLRRLGGERTGQAGGHRVGPAEAVLEEWVGEVEGGDSSPSAGWVRDAEVVDALVREIAQQPDPGTRLTLMGVVGGYEPETALDLSLEGLGHSDASMRYGSVQLLWRRAADGDASRPDVTRGLAQATLDPDPRVRQAALLALEDLEGLGDSRRSDPPGGFSASGLVGADPPASPSRGRAPRRSVPSQASP